MRRGIKSKKIPSYFTEKNPLKSFEKVLDERRRIYEKILAFCVDAENKTEKQVVESLCEIIKNVKESNGK